MDHFLAVRAFACVVEAGSFTKAAEALHLPKATVTKLVQQLELHLHTKLLQRTTRRVTVTPEGAAYHEHTARLMAELDDVESGLSNAQPAPRGRLRVDVGAAVAGLILIPALPEFCSRYPGIRFDLGVGERPVELLGDNVDCAIRSGALAGSSWLARPIGTLAWMTCATPAYLAGHGTPQHPRELQTGHWVAGHFSARTGRTLPLRFERESEGKREAVEIAADYRVSAGEVQAQLAIALAGLGLVQMPAFMLEPHVERGELTPVLAEWQPPAQALHIAHPPTGRLGNRLQVFIDWAAGVFASVR